MRNNTLLFDPKYKLSFWFSCDVFKLYTTDYKDYNHMIAAGSLTINGLSSAKNFGYNKVHWFDYDTVFLDDSELIENSTLLDSYSIIWYRHSNLGAFSGMSFNLNKIDQDWFDTSNNAFYSFLNNSSSDLLNASSIASTFLSLSNSFFVFILSAPNAPSKNLFWSFLFY